MCLYVAFKEFYSSLSILESVRMQHKKNDIITAVMMFECL